MNKFKLLVAAIAAFGVAGIGNAAMAQNVSAYGGLSANYSYLDVDVGGGSSFSDGVAAGSLFLGVESTVSSSSNVSVGVEAAFEYFDEFEDSGNTLEVIGGSVAAKVFVPLSQSGIVRLSGQAGVLFGDAEVNGVSDTGSDALLGAGIDFRVAPGARLGFDYRYVFEDDTDWHITGLRALYYF